MSMEVTRQEDGLVVITLNDPDRRNPLGHVVRQDLCTALAAAEGDDTVPAVVLTGAGGQFSAGGDIRDQGERSIAEHRARMSVIGEMVNRMTGFSKPLVAAVEGWAAGGGFSLALACPTIIAARDARFTAGFSKIGLMPDLGLLATLPMRVGVGRARRIMLDNPRIGAPEALDLGIVDGLADPGQALARALEVAREEAATAPLPRMYLNDFFRARVLEALDYERRVQPVLLNSADAAEGRAAFREKRAPKFSGR